MTALSDVARWCYKNPGISSIADVAAGVGCPRSTAGNALQRLAELEPKVLKRVGLGVYLIRPPDFTEHQDASPPPPPEPQVNGYEPTFEEILPDAEDLYPPIKIQIYDYWFSKNREKWFRVRDEHGMRGVFHYIDDDR